MLAWAIRLLITFGAIRQEAHNAHYNARHRTGALRCSALTFLLTSILSSTIIVDAVKCGCGACESNWFQHGWICRVTFQMQVHPESLWTIPDFSLNIMGEPTPWTLVIDNAHGTTMYSMKGQCVHLPPGVYGATDTLLALLLLPLCGTPCPSPHDPLLALLNTSSSASGDISLNDVEDPPQETQQQSAGSSQDVAAPHSATLRLSPR